MTVKTHNNAKGNIRAFDVRTGKKLWVFHPIPRPGDNLFAESLIAVDLKPARGNGSSRSFTI